MEPGGPMWSQEALLCRVRRPSVDPGGAIWNQETVEPGGPPL